MYEQCKEVGPKYCMQVKYEDLVLHPRPTLKKILAFADLEWTENVMEHQKHMGDISLSSVERSTDQVWKDEQKQPKFFDAYNLMFRLWNRSTQTH